ncbi:MAG: pilus assembly protein [Pirellulaceae bacterium]|jgi:Flp pilus assembly protein TadG|nr:pilus assembly protein [Pirellulaceae bacterium]
MKRNRRSRSRRRRGGAIVELAIALPLLTGVVVATMELSGVIYNMQALQSTAHECAREAARRSGTNGRLQTLGKSILSQRGLKGAVIRTSPGNIANLNRGTEITVTVSAPYSNNSWLPHSFFNRRAMQAQTVVVKQY